MKKILMIAYMFPPAGGIGIAGAQRVLKFAKYLPKKNWQPIILTVKPSSYESYLAMDPSLDSKVSPDLPVIRTSVFRGLTWILKKKKRVMDVLRPKPVSKQVQAVRVSPVVHNVSKGWFQTIKDSFTDLFEIPDEEMGWFVPAVWAGVKSVRRQQIDLIYATGRPWTAFLIGRMIKGLTGKPLVVDFRDPWMTNPFRISYSTMKDRVEAYLEQMVVSGADMLIANTETLRAEFLSRFPDEDPSKFVTVSNGFDPEDFKAEESHLDMKRPNVYTMTHTGFLYGKRDPQEFLKALQQLIESKRIEADKIRVQFLGAIDLAYDLETYLRTLHLESIVTLHDHRPFQEALQFLKGSDGLLLLQPGTATQIPSKLFEYIGLGKPILAICPAKSATEDLMKENNLGRVVQPESSQEIAEGIAALYKQWSAGSGEPAETLARSEKFNVDAITTDLVRKFSVVIP